jgi:5-oxoprolinase (ATP-hydrolysing)
VHRRVHVRYEGTDSAIVVPFGDAAPVQASFEAVYRQRFAFLMSERRLIVEAVSVEAVGAGDAPVRAAPRRARERRGAGEGERAHVLRRAVARRRARRARTDARPGQAIDGPAIVAEKNATTIVEPGWRARITALDHLVLERVAPRAARQAIGTSVDPVLLEVFNHLFMNIASRWGCSCRTRRTR